MSGHSKFANIKHKKEKNDAAKGKIFTKIGRDLQLLLRKVEVLIRQTTADFVMLLQKQKQTTCRMIQSREISKKLPEKELLITMSVLHMKDMDRTEPLLSLRLLQITRTVQLPM